MHPAVAGQFFQLQPTIKAMYDSVLFELYVCTYVGLEI